VAGLAGSFALFAAVRLCLCGIKRPKDNMKWRVMGPSAEIVMDGALPGIGLSGAAVLQYLGIRGNGDDIGSSVNYKR